SSHGPQGSARGSQRSEKGHQGWRQAGSEAGCQGSARRPQGCSSGQERSPSGCTGSTQGCPSLAGISREMDERPDFIGAFFLTATEEDLPGAESGAAESCEPFTEDDRRGASGGAAHG